MIMENSNYTDEQRAEDFNSEIELRSVFPNDFKENRNPFLEFIAKERNIPVESLIAQQQQIIDDKKSDEAERDLLKENLLPCPFCGESDLGTTCVTSRGHGDSGFERYGVVCNNCSAHKGDIYGYGSPTIKNEIEAYKIWNQRKQ